MAAPEAVGGGGIKEKALATAEPIKSVYQPQHAYRKKHKQKQQEQAP